MLMPTAAGSEPIIVRPQAFAFRAIFSACACSSRALVGMHPQSRHVPPSAFCFSTTATLRPSCAARMAATYPPVPAPITMTSYSLVTFRPPFSPLQRRQGDERDLTGFARGAGARLFRQSLIPRARRIEPADTRAQLAVLVAQLPVGFGEPVQPAGDPARPEERGESHEDGQPGSKPQ